MVVFLSISNSGVQLAIFYSPQAKLHLLYCHNISNCHFHIYEIQNDCQIHSFVTKILFEYNQSFFHLIIPMIGLNLFCENYNVFFLNELKMICSIYNCKISFFFDKKIGCIFLFLKFNLFQVGFR